MTDLMLEMATALEVAENNRKYNFKWAIQRVHFEKNLCGLNTYEDERKNLIERILNSSKNEFNIDFCKGIEYYEYSYTNDFAEIVNHRALKECGLTISPSLVKSWRGIYEDGICVDGFIVVVHDLKNHEQINMPFMIDGEVQVEERKEKEEIQKEEIQEEQADEITVHWLDIRRNIRATSVSLDCSEEKAEQIVKMFGMPIDSRGRINKMQHDVDEVKVLRRWLYDK